MQKSRLIEKIAELLNDKKLPLVADVRDESAEDVRVVIEPRARTVDAELLMESLFKLTELESRIPLNMNVLVAGPGPRGDGPRRGRCATGSTTAATCWCAAPTTACARSSDRLEVLDGYLIAYLNLDEVIRIIRNEDEPKPVLIARLQAHRGAGRGHPQHAAAQPAQAGGNGDPRRSTRICARSARTLRGSAGLGSGPVEEIGDEIKAVRKTFGPKTPLGKRRTHIRRGAGP